LAFAWVSRRVLLLALLGKVVERQEYQQSVRGVVGRSLEKLVVFFGFDSSQAAFAATSAELPSSLVPAAAGIVEAN